MQLPRIRPAAIIVACVLASCAARAMPQRTQTFALKAGWNAVFLRVQPAETKPGTLFADTAIDIVACYLTPNSTIQFLQDPGEKPWNNPGWLVWYAAGRPDAFLSNLENVAAHKPYLVHATQDTSWTVTGAVSFRRVAWQPNAFNLIGFNVLPDNPPTFAGFFAGSQAHEQQRFYRLVNGHWTLVTSPHTTQLAPGAAYWVYCRGASTFQGPLDVSAGNSSQLAFTAGATHRKVRVGNTGTVPASLTIQRTGTLPAFYRRTNRETLSYTSHPLGNSLDLGTMESGDDTDLLLHVEPNSTEPQQALLEIRHDVGVRAWMPLVFTEH